MKIKVMFLLYFFSIFFSNAEEKEWPIINQEVHFLENKGQMTDMDGNPIPFVLYKIEASNLDLFITEKGLTFVQFNIQKTRSNNETVKMQNWERVDMELVGASIQKEHIVQEGMSNESYKYFLAHCPDGITDVHRFQKLTIKDVYPGIDWVLYNSNEKGFKYDFIVHPTADPNQIRMVYRSKEKPFLDEEGNLNFQTRFGSIQENAPVSYLKESKKNVPTQFIIKETKPITFGKDEGFETEINFNIQHSTFNIQHSTLVIDPKLEWATFMGASNNDDGFHAVEYDSNDNIYAVGYSYSNNYPTVDNGGYFQGTRSSSQDGVLSKFDANFNLEWSTYYGGNSSDMIRDIAIDNNNAVVFTGETRSTDFPVCTTCSGYSQSYQGSTESFIVKFDNTGQRIWATYFGGNYSDYAKTVVTDQNNRIYVLGYCSSSNIPLMDAGGFYQGTYRGSWDCFILRFDQSGSMEWSTYYGGTSNEEINDACIDPENRLIVTGHTSSSNFPTQDRGGHFINTHSGGKDLFLLRFDENTQQEWGTYYQGSGHDYGNSIDTDNEGNIFVMGFTSSTDFSLQDNGTFYQPNLAGEYDAFIVKFDSATTREWATYYGGSLGENKNTLLKGSRDNLVVDNCGNVYMSFTTNSTDLSAFASCGGYVDHTYNGGDADIFLSFFNNDGELKWASYFGGNGYDFREALAINDSKELVIAGEWSDAVTDASYPLTDPGGVAYFDNTHNGYDDQFIAKFSFKDTMELSIVESGTGDCVCSAEVIPICGIGPFEYSWDSGQNTSVVTNLCGGKKYVTVTDQGACDLPPILDSIDITGCLPMDVEIVSFTAECSNHQTTLTWSCHSDPNENPIQVQRSMDGIEWETIASVHNKEGHHEYTYEDYKNIRSNSGFYRLYLPKKEGETIISQVITAPCKRKEGVWIYPNPANSHLNLLLNSSYKGEIQLQIHNALGQLVDQKKITTSRTKSTLSIRYYTFFSGHLFCRSTGGK